MSWVRARIVSRRAWAADLASLTLDAIAPGFVPGQFVNLALDRGDERVKRSYSLASAPGQPSEVYLSLVDGGALTPSLFELAVGDELWLDDRPLGFFTLEHVPPARDLWLLSTGTGLGPFLSILRSGVAWDRFERIVVANGARDAAHLGYADELRALAAQGPALAYVPLLTREAAPGDGLSGRIPSSIESGALEGRAGFPLDPSRSHVMLCGNPEMIADAERVLAARGLVKHRKRRPGHVTIESYW